MSIQGINSPVDIFGAEVADLWPRGRQVEVRKEPSWPRGQQVEVRKEPSWPRGQQVEVRKEPSWTRGQQVDGTKADNVWKRAHWEKEKR